MSHTDPIQPVIDAVAPPQGFRIAGTHCGLKQADKPDIALLFSDRPCRAAGVFTTNHVKAAPVLYDMDLCARPGVTFRAVLTNTGSANACTGQRGLDAARQSAAWVAEAAGLQPDEVLTLSTGVIGLHLDLDAVRAGITTLTASVAQDGWHEAAASHWRGAAAAIMTTDTRPKLASVQVDGYTITGIAKGAGMIAPNMATMLGVIATDADVPQELLDRALPAAAAQSFNRIVVDGDMSTNDTVLLLANGASGVAVTAGDGADRFVAALTALCIALAQAIVRDGEGATKFVALHITGAANDASAEQVARAIATSALVKTAFYGADPNWGRVLAAAGRSGVDVDPDALALWLLDADGAEAIQLVADGRPLDYDEPAAIAHMSAAEWGMRLDLGQGSAATEVWTCDFSHDYVTINGHYRT